ncbi:MAG: nitroreductase family deazaflavin-dependent oxidoreductase [Actinomycetota bacterium]
MSDRSFVSNWSSHQFCYLTTIGRRTGNPHTIEIWFVVEGGSIWLFTEPDGWADWVRNLRREPRVTLRLGEMEVEATAEVIEVGADASVRQAIAERYQGSDDNLDHWARGALAVRVTPNL